MRPIKDGEKIDCMAVVESIKLNIHQQIKDMSDEERLNYFRKTPRKSDSDENAGSVHMAAKNN